MMKMKITSIRARLLLWNIGLLAAILFGFLLATHFAVRGYLLSSIDGRLEGMSRWQARIFERIDDNDRPPPPPPPRPDDHERRRGSRFQRTVRFFDMNGEALVLNSPSTEPQPPPWDAASLKRAAAGISHYSFAQDEDGPVRVLTKPLIRDKKQVGVVQFATSFAEAEVMLDSLTLMLLLLVPCALLIAGLGGYFLTRHTLGPIRRMVDAAEALNPDDLSQRLPVVGADEFAHLATTMNGMLGRLDSAFTSLRESVERERRFTADASHELRTPLTAIKANTSLALKGERAPEQYRQALQAVDQATDSMTRLVQDLLLLARSDSGQLTLTEQAVNPRDLFEDALSMLRPGKDQAPVSIVVDEGTGTIRGDHQHLRRLIGNLLENALRYTPAEGSITLAARRQDETVVLTVADTGEGIAPDELSHLGERFFRADPSRARLHGGAGLGLAICRSIVDAHHGTMTINSTPGDGTRVTVTLPAG
ncbi:MAG: sensor histidine kinase [Armatimonadota bacterium]